jgi:outer membrane protein
MKIIIHLLFIFFLAITTNISLAQPLTLDDCILLAKENNLELIQAKMNIDNARAALTEANSSYYPSLGLSSGYRTGGDFSDSSNTSSRFSSGVNASYALYRGGSIRAGSKIAKTRVEIAEENYRQKENEVVLSVKQTFLKILQTQEQITLISSILKRRDENLTLIKLNYSVGRENQPNVSQAEASLNQTEYDYMKAEQNLALAKLALNLLLNRSEQDINIIYEDKDMQFPLLDTLIETAKNQRPEVISEILNRDVVEVQLSQAKSNYLPALSISSSYGLGGDDFLKQSGSWSAGINLSLPLFNGFSTSAKVKQATIALEQEDLKLKNLENNIIEEVSQAYSNWKLGMKNLEVSSKTLQATRDAYQLTKLQYEQGRTSYFFLQQKESELTQAENGYVNALYNLRASGAALEQAIGRSN